MDFLFPLGALLVTAWALYFTVTDGERRRRRDQERERLYWERWRRNDIAASLAAGIPIDEAIALARETEANVRRNGLAWA